MIEYTQRQKDLQMERQMEDFFAFVEELASKYEVTCDYILQEFILD